MKNKATGLALDNDKDLEQFCHDGGFLWYSRLQMCMKLVLNSGTSLKSSLSRRLMYDFQDSPGVGVAVELFAYSSAADFRDAFSSSETARILRRFGLGVTSDSSSESFGT